LVLSLLLVELGAVYATAQLDGIEQATISRLYRPAADTRLDTSSFARAVRAVGQLRGASLRKAPKPAVQRSLDIMIPVFATGLALAAAAGRLRRADGPAIQGPAVVVAVVAGALT